MMQNRFALSVVRGDLQRPSTLLSEFCSSLSFVFGILIEWAYVSYRDRPSRHKCFSDVHRTRERNMRLENL